MGSGREFDIGAARRTLRKRLKKKREILRGRWLAARSDFDRIVAMLIDTYRPARIWQWGSLLDEARFSNISDIDIAVEGVRSAEEFFAMYGDADRMTGFSLDMVQMEAIEPEFAQLIRMKGKVVYESRG